VKENEKKVHRVTNVALWNDLLGRGELFERTPLFN
jgi:hypothetical protein